MKLSANEIKLNGLRASNCATIQRVLILKICLRAQNVSESFEKRAPGSLLTAYQPIQIIATTNKSLCSFFFIPHLFSQKGRQRYLVVIIIDCIGTCLSGSLYSMAERQGQEKLHHFGLNKDISNTKYI